jgi:hypothetical protein
MLRTPDGPRPFGRYGQQARAAAIYKTVTSRGQGVLVTANGGTGALYPYWGTRP